MELAMKFNKILRGAILSGALAASLGGVSSASAAVVYSGSSDTLAGSASFDIIGTQLKLVLTNTSTFDVTKPEEVLTALFFNVSGLHSLSASSAMSGGPTYLNGLQVNGAGTNVGGEWGFKNFSVGTFNSGISSSGLGGTFGQSNFNGLNLDGPVALGGLEYGITSAGDNLATDNGGIRRHAITKNSVTFLLDITGPFTLNQINAVSFQYGTALVEPHFTGSCVQGTPGCGTITIQAIPEPASIALVGLGLLGASLARRRRVGK